MADLTSLYADRASFGVTDTLVPTSPLRLQGLAVATVGSLKVSIDANGNVTSGPLLVGDIPSDFPSRNLPEVIMSDWQWSYGKTISFATGPLAPPAATSRSVGTRLVLEPVPGSTEYAVGRETNALWTSVPLGSFHKWFQGATVRLQLESDGTLDLMNGSGWFSVSGAGGAGGVLYAPNGLGIYSGSGGIAFDTASGLIQPVTGYKENLGKIDRKWLSVHAAELWVETLVAQQTMATVGGRLLIGPTTSLTRDVAVGDTTIYVKHNSLALHVASIEYGSKLVLEVAGKFEVMAVTSAAVPTATAQGDYPYTVLRAWGGTASAWFAGDAVFDTGKATAPAGAFIDLYSVRGVNPGSTAGPTIVGNLRVNPNATDWRERWAIGQLQGLYGNGSSVFGAAFGDATNMHLQIDATNGIRMLNGPYVYGQWAMNGDVAVGYPTAGQLLFTAADGVLRTRYNGVDKMILNSDGTLRLATQLIVGGLVPGPVSIRSYLASAFNSGVGFYFGYDTTTTITTALIGDSTGRRIQWTGTSLKVVSDGLTIDENGITLQQQTTGVYAPSKAIQWTGNGGRLWDSQTNNALQIERLTSGSIRLTAQNEATGEIRLQAGGSYLNASNLTMGATHITVGGYIEGGLRPAFQPDIDNVMDLGLAARRWRRMWTGDMYASYFVGNAPNSWVKTIYGAFAGASPSAYYLEVAQDSAGKPASSTWQISPSNREAKDDVRSVDRADALALVRRVDVVRYRYNGALDSPVGVSAIGVVAEDVALIMPDSVKPDLTGSRLGWNAHELFMLNVAAVQALAARLDALDERIRP